MDNYIYNWYQTLLLVSVTRNHDPDDQKRLKLCFLLYKQYEIKNDLPHNEDTNGKLMTIYFFILFLPNIRRLVEKLLTNRLYIHTIALEIIWKVYQGHGDLTER